LVGGVGSGKSTLARRAAERYGVAVIDADAAGHRALVDPEVKARIRQRFGDQVFDAQAEVDRSRLARVVFGASPEHAVAKFDLEAITHPVIRRELEQRIADAQASAAPAVLLDAAVLFEAHWQDACDAIVFVDTPEPLRKARVAARGWSEAEWAKREASQLPLDEKRRRADALIDNSGALDSAADELAATIERLCHIRLPGPAALAGASA
jgi:dephospho-CoA kinase